MTEQKRPNLFPIMSISYDYREKVEKIRTAGVQQIVLGIPWEMITPHEAQAKANHGQTLRRLAERGGLGVCEAVAILEDRPWHSMPGSSAYHQLSAKLARFNADCARAEAEAELNAV